VTHLASRIPDDDSTIVVGLFETDHGPEGGSGAAQLGSELGIELSSIAAASPGFVGRRGQRATVVAATSSGARAIVLVGLGARTTLTAASLRDAAIACRAGGPANAVTSLLAREGTASVSALNATTEGHLLGSWRYRRPDAGSALSTTDLTIVAGSGDDVVGERDKGRFQDAVDRATLVAEATNWVRQLVETPPNELGPEEFAATIADFATGSGVAVSVWSTELLRDRRFGATLGVGSGSVRPPLVVELTTSGTGEGGPTTALAGKGITFDSGGINLKRDLGELAWMKSDMAAAASVAAATITASRLGVGAQHGAIHAILPVADNMPSLSAQRPGDVVTHPSGRTTEIVDTDCEGRLVLADAISWLAASNPRAIIDVGTLTDSGGVGTAYWGCWGTAPLAAAMVQAGAAAGDPGWYLPLHDSYLELLSSRVADIANASDDFDSGQLAATYLSSFVGDVPWLHIDNGSGAWLEKDSGSWPAGPTGTPLRALIEFLTAG
jgi:leucyl aminopeptidase